MSIEIMLSTSAIAVARLRGTGGPLDGLKLVRRTFSGYCYRATPEQALAIAEALEGCSAFNAAGKLNYVRDPDVESDTYTVRIAVAMIRRALQNPRPA